MGISAFLSKASRANDIKDLIVVFDGFLDKQKSNFGVKKKFRVSIDKTRREANRKALDVLNQITDPLLVTDEQKEILRGYTGEGNIGGSTNEYYTPTWLADGMWNMLKQYGGAQGNILEPSAGTGVFNGSKPQGVIMTATELSPTSSRINQILHPEDQVKNTNFEKFAADSSTDNTFDSVVGNVPFAKSRAGFAKDDPDYAHHKVPQSYFVDRAIDKVKPGGYITLVVPQDIVGAKSFDEFRAQISLKAEFLGAHKIAAGAFTNQGSTSVVTDVLIMRKHSAEMAELISNAKTETLRETKVLWNQFIKGQWFDKDGKKFINGEIIEGAANYGRDLVAIPNLPKAEAGKQLNAEQTQAKSEMIDSHNQATAKSLSKKFESRIDWDALALAEPEAISYIEGDQRQINGRWHEYIDGEWLPVKLSNTNGMLDTEKFGTNSISGITELVRTPESALALDFNQLKNINSNFRDKTEGIIGNAFTLAAQHPAGHQERIVKGVLIGAMIEDYSKLREYDKAAAAVKLQEIQSELKAVYEKLGSSHKVKGLKRVTGDQTAGYYQSFVNAMDKDGKFSDLISGQLDTSATIDFDTTNAQHTVDMLTHGIDSEPVSLDEFRDAFTGTMPEHVDINDDDSLLDYLSEFDNIAVDNNGHVLQFDRATSGEIALRNAALMRALANDHLSEKQKLNINRQLEAIKAKRTVASKEEIVFDLRGKWIPRQMVVEFFHDQGYDDLDYSAIEVDEDGNVTEKPGYEGMDGLFTGYYSKDGKNLPNNDDTKFFRQVEQYLNGETVRASDGIESSKRREQIRAMEKQFQHWMRQHPNVDSVVDKYNDTFNGKIPFAHSDAPLNLENVSGNIVNMGYQNSAIRRLSEEGRGILGFGTGLGKTFTALGMVAHNMKEKRSNRTCIVVPKAVSENWVNETVDFFGYNNLSKVMFVGFDLERDENGEYKKETVVVDGEVKTYPANGAPKTKPVLRVIDAKEEITERMHQIPHSNKTLVIMTKEQFAKIPMQPASIKDNAAEHMGNLSATGKVDLFADSYKKQQTKEAALAALVKDGSSKDYDYPFFEEMHFDTVITDEAHNYRNSQEAGKQARSLAYLSTGTEAKAAADMRQKMQYLGRKQNGRGAILLTATPTPNSPLDIYNMLSHILKPEEWLKMGIADQDDFINVFGETSEVQKTRIDGSLAMTQGLTGFKNLKELRKLFDGYCNRKNIKDVASETKVPEIVNAHTVVEMNEQQQETYDMLRLRAEVIRAAASDGGIDELTGPMGGKTPAEIALIDEIQATYPDDQIFSVMRDMERVSTDMDLFDQRMTFIFPKDKAKAAQAVIDGIKTPIKIKMKEIDDAGKEKNVTVEVDLDPEVIADDDGKYIVKINDAFETALVAGLKKQKLTQSDITHPVPPKYARLLNNLKNAHENGGKQIIFTEEKTQHKKLHRMICHHLGLEPNEVGILNGSTVSGDESAVNDANHKKLGPKALKKLKEELAAQGLDTADTEQEGLETIAKRYNNGQFRVLICNKKAEVGVNLHIETTDIHHLSLPWTPASIDQRNGRGARVGAPQSHVNSHFYLAKGSFDKFRLDTINRKRKWQDDLINGEALRADNGDADNDNDADLLLANNPEEYAALLAQRKREFEEKVQQSKVESARFSLGQYLRAAKLSKIDTSDLEETEARQITDVEREQRWVDDAQDTLDNARSEYEQKEAEGLEDEGYYGLRYYRRAVESAEKKLKKALTDHRKSKSPLKKTRNRIKAVEKARKQVKQFKPQVAEAIDSGTLSDVDKGLVDNPSDYLFDGKRTIKAGSTYLMTSEDGYITVRVKSCDHESQILHLEGISDYVRTSDEFTPDKLLDEVAISESEEELAAQLRKDYYNESKAYALLENDTFFDFLGRSLLPPGLSVLTSEDNDDGEYELMDLKNTVDKSKIIYPDKNSESLKEATAKIFIRNHKAGKYQGNTEKLCKVLFGEQYKDEIAAYNEDSETDEEIAQFVKDNEHMLLVRYDSLLKDAIVEESTHSAIMELKRSRYPIHRLIPSGAFRHDAFVSAIDARTNELVAQLEAEYTNKLQQLTDKNSQVIKQAASSTAEEIKARLDTLPSAFYTANLYSQDTAKAFIAEHIAGTAYKGFVAGLVIDLISAGYTDPRDSEDSNLTPGAVLSLIAQMQQKVKRDRLVLDRFLGKIDDEPETQATPVEATGGDDVPASADTSDIPFAAILKEKFNITCQRNTTAFEAKTKRGKTYASGEPYEYIFMQDPIGRDGPLNEALSPLKRQKKANWKVSVSPEFDGFWWFVEADMPEEEVLRAFGL